jgi:hypothetical protein
MTSVTPASDIPNRLEVSSPTTRPWTTLRFCGPLRGTLGAEGCSAGIVVSWIMRQPSRRRRQQQPSDSGLVRRVRAWLYEGRLRKGILNIAQRCAFSHVVALIYCGGLNSQFDNVFGAVWMRLNRPAEHDDQHILSPHNLVVAESLTTADACRSDETTSLHRRLSRRVHHITAPVTNIAAGASPKTAQINFVVQSQSPRPPQGIPMPLMRPKCK